MTARWWNTRRATARRERADGLWSAAGQTTVEYLMIAGLFAAIAIFLLKTLPKGMGTYAKALVYSVRTVAP